MDAEQRLVELESRMAFQDETIRALNDSIAAQDKLILDMQRELKALRNRLRELVHSMGDSPVAPASEETPPPHY